MRKKQKRILIDTFYLNNAITGIQTYTLELCQAFASYGKEDDIVFFTPFNNLKTNQLAFFQNKPRLWKRLMYHPYYFLWKQVVLPLVVLFKKIDVLICPDYVAPIIGFKALKLVVLHDAFFWEHKTHYNAQWRAYYTWMVEQGLKRKAVGVTTSNYSRKKLAAYLPEISFEVVYQCAKSLAKDSDISVLHKHDLNRAGYILHVGYLDKRKNLPLLINSFHKLKSTTGEKRLKLVLGGRRASSKGLDDYDRIVELISNLGLQDEVILPGYVSNEELKALYTNALFYVFPSKDEGFGIPVLEAMMHNIPVIISDAGSLSEIGGDGVLKFELDNPEDLYYKMYKLYSSQDLRVEFRDKGSKRAAQFNREFFYQQFEKIVDDVTCDSKYSNVDNNI